MDIAAAITAIATAVSDYCKYLCTPEGQRFAKMVNDGTVNFLDGVSKVENSFTKLVGK